MTVIDGQRWGRVPENQFPVRTVLIAWRKGDADRVRAHVQRQIPYNLSVSKWVSDREGAYHEAYVAEPLERLHNEAALDLICWQRQEPRARQVLEWLKRWEEQVTAFEQQQTTKGTKGTKNA
jgi:hypothetical protein